MNIRIIGDFLKENLNHVNLVKEEFNYWEYIIPEFCSSDGSEQCAELIIKETWHDGCEYYSYDICVGDITVFHFDGGRKSIFFDLFYKKYFGE